MKNLIFIFIVGILFSCCESPRQKVSVQGPGPDVDYFETKSSPLVKTNVDTSFIYYNSMGANFIITKLPFENKLITILYPEGSSADFKIVTIDTTNTIDPHFKPIK